MIKVILDPKNPLESSQTIEILALNPTSIIYIGLPVIPLINSDITKPPTETKCFGKRLGN